MKLPKDMEFDNDLLMELILMFQDDKHQDELHHFADDEPLGSLDRDELIKKITKSFGIELIKIEKVVKNNLDSNDLNHTSLYKRTLICVKFIVENFRILIKQRNKYLIFHVFNFIER